jgi:hypothetical protein
MPMNRETQPRAADPARKRVCLAAAAPGDYPSPPTAQATRLIRRPVLPSDLARALAKLAFDRRPA